MLHMSIPRAVAHVPYLGRLHSRWQVANILAEGNAGSAKAYNTGHCQAGAEIAGLSKQRKDNNIYYIDLL